MGLSFSAQQVSEFGEKAVSDILNAESFLIANSNLILVIFVPSRFDLKGVGLNLLVPEPLCAPDLNILGVCRINIIKTSVQLSLQIYSETFKA